MAIKNYINQIKKLSTLHKLLVVCGLLLLFILIVETPWSPKFSRHNNSKSLMSQLNEQEIKKISIENPEEAKSATLEKRDKIWVLINGQSFPADDKKIKELINKINLIRSEEVISKNPERHELFNVDKKSGTHIVIWNNRDKTIADFFIGKSTESNQQYIRLASSDETHKSNQNITSLTQQTKEDWKDKTLFESNEEEIRKLTLYKEGDEITLERKDESWTMPQYNNQLADSLVARTLFERIKYISADEFASAAEGSQVDFKNPDYRISVRKMDEGLNIVLFKQAEDGKYYAKSGESSFTYLVSKELIDSIFGLQLLINN